MSTALPETKSLGPTPQPTNRPRRWVARHQITIFVLVTMAVSWLFVPVADGGLLPHGPMLAALLVLALVAGRQGVAELWHEMTRWRVRWTWYLIAPGIFVVMHGITLGVSSAFGMEMTGIGPSFSASALLGALLPLVLLGGQWEEPGWLGYLVRRLQQLRLYSPLLVLLIAGLVRVVWHTPLVLLGTIPWHDFLFGILALQVILLWLYNRTGGSVLLPVICHLFSNLTMATVLPLVSEPGLYWLAFTVVEVAVGLGIVLATRGRLGLTGHPAQRRLRHWREPVGQS
jgi:CAAX protease family protein